MISQGHLRAARSKRVAIIIQSSCSSELLIEQILVQTQNLCCCSAGCSKLCSTPMSMSPAISSQKPLACERRVHECMDILCTLDATARHCTASALPCNCQLINTSVSGSAPHRPMAACDVHLAPCVGQLPSQLRNDQLVSCSSIQTGPRSHLSHSQQHSSPGQSILVIEMK